jgi:branched-chain amino acid transport system ATP-binding protein|tara:strand:- start:10866 stop:11624 length:759 start_codon:yes stop_codon:yes gene_type:complete
MFMLEVRNLTKSFGGVHAMQGVSLSFADGSLSAIIGPNGAGKTTFFNLISGKLRADSGQVIHDGTDVVGMKPLDIVRRGVGRAFQIASLFPELTVRQSLASAVTSHQRGALRLGSRFPSSQSRDRADGIMEMVGLSAQADVTSKYLPHGDQKLLDVALALAMEPSVLLLDEPTAGMGSEERWKMIDKVRALWRQTGITLLFIEHDMDIVFEIAERIDVLKYGKVLASGNAEEIRTNPDVIEAYLGVEAGDAA